MRKLAVGVAVVAVFGVVAAAIGSAAGPFVPTLTGCYSAKAGLVYSIAKGDKPLRKCLGADVAVSFSAGDVTGISAGAGLTGGGDNGEVTLALDPAYALPQSCVAGQVAKWSGTAWTCAADQSGTYAAGDGLELIGNEFRLKGCANGQTPRYTIPGGWTCVNLALASQSCSAGTFAQGITGGGLLSCGAPVGGDGGVQAYVGTQINPTQGGAVTDAATGVPDDFVERPYASVTVPPGTYLVQAKAEVDSTRNVDAFTSLRCRLNDYADEVVFGEVVLNDEPQSWFSLIGMITSNGGALSLICSADEGADGISLAQARISAVKVG